MEYSIKRSKRKTMSLEVTLKGTLVVHAPLKMSEKTIDEFVNKYSAWAEEKLKIAKKRADKNNEITANEEFLRESAKSIIPILVEKYSEIMGLKPTSVKITSAERRFGSCSAKNGLCFSYRLMAYPKEAVEYVVVHELAHIKHHNHSKAFYNLIERYMPDYKNRQKMLKDI